MPCSQSLSWNIRMRCALLTVLVMSSLVFSSCAAPVKQQSAGVLEPAQAPKQFRVLEEVDVSMSTGYKTKIKAETNWTLAGTIVQGEVYKSRDQVLTVEGYDVHEAYLVVSGDELVGFYLPVEHNFAPILPTKHLRITR
jgi:hypothetical protein